MHDLYGKITKSSGWISEMICNIRFLRESPRVAGERPFLDIIYMYVCVSVCVCARVHACIQSSTLNFLTFTNLKVNKKTTMTK